MQIKKYPNAALENYSKILIQLGLVLSLFIVYEFMNMKSYPNPIKEIVGNYTIVDDTEENIEVKVLEPEIKPPAKLTLPDKIVQVEDEVEVIETLIESTETDETDAIVIDIDKDVISVVEEEEVVEDVPFMVIEDVPVFPGCSGNNSELRACFSSQMTKFVSKRFNAELASDLGLEKGTIQRIFVMFKIDKNGDIVDIQARAPHKKLQAEAIRVIKLLPHITPGRQRGRPVGVKYGLPIVFKVE
ncbi:MAG: energy transducer TonB [Lutibacter sp.]|uniref:energy transducer TonB n=1 Tax=Lutibacter sp. TaxID=1925666 RepID=UPI001807EAF9|nr:energy transducer TonB [Lutibacter sp.]MBT8316461.1 energy transducer TonB [Lutibacter sp.]NNJ57321.1 energy transducer TonB [Lutibacter sp.]